MATMGMMVVPLMGCDSWGVGEINRSDSGGGCSVGGCGFSDSYDCGGGVSDDCGSRDSGNNGFSCVRQVFVVVMVVVICSLMEWKFNTLSTRILDYMQKYWDNPSKTFKCNGVYPCKNELWSNSSRYGVGVLPVHLEFDNLSFSKLI